MLHIEITEKNAEKINAAIAAAEGKARSRKADFSDCLQAVETMREEIPCTLRDLEGSGMFYQPGAQAFPSAYHGVPEATYLRITAHNGRFYLTGAGRMACDRKADHGYRLSETAKAGIVAHLEKSYR